MTDYSSWKVADLKTELKSRGIPQTGLRLKQQIIDKLVEEDAKAQPEEAAAPSEHEPEPEPEPEPAPEVQQPAAEEPAPLAQDAQNVLASEEPKQDAPVAQEEPSQPSPTREEETPRKDEIIAQQEAPEAASMEQGQAGDEDTEMTQVEPTAPGKKDQEKIDTQPVEQVLGDVGEPAKATEISVPSTLPTSEANTEFSTPLPIEEALEDKRKRKRRSQSPVPTPEAIANKKARAEEESPRDLLQDDNEYASQGIETKDTAIEQQGAPAEQKEAPSAPPKQDARFRGLFAPSGPGPARKPSPGRDVAMEDAEVEPALHPATAALYIDGLMRPLQPNALRSHLISLAAAPGSDPNPDIIQDFFLDAIKTHCFAGFTDIACASRVRAALHGTVWPNERNRKTLRADFIPEDKIKEWIQTEEASRDRVGPPVRWEVQYEPSSEGKGIRAILAEAGASTSAVPSRPQREAGFNRTPPLGPRGSASGHVDRRPSDAPPAPPSRPGQGFKPLDDLFESTTTKPKLYYLRVPRKVADKRLDQFDDLLKKGTFPRRGGDDMRRITFEDEDYFVDGGSEYGAKGMPRRPPGRGGRPGGRRGRD